MTSSPEMFDHDNHLTNETLAVFADGRAAEAECRAVVAHLAECDDCRDDLLMIKEVQEHGVVDKGGNVVRGNFIRRVLIGVAAAAAAMVSIGFVPAVRTRIQFYRTGGVSELVAASEQLTKRPNQARLTGGFPYKQFTTPRGEGTIQRGESKEEHGKIVLEIAARRVQEKGSERGAGIAHLLLGKRDEAVTSLERALASRPKDPLLLSDCAAAHIERSRYSRDDAAARDLARARELADSAWTMKKTPEIAWNRALARELAYRPDAGQAWKDYLQLDSESPWADEARSHLNYD